MVHAVIERTAPGTPVIDLTHQIPPQNVRAGALALWRAGPWLVPGVILAVVDPGVGTERRAVAIETEQAALIGPDNGLLLPAALRLGPITGAVALSGAQNTFAGRDVFAPAAARLANGEPLASLGPPVDPGTLQGHAVPDPIPSPRGLHAEVLWVDRYGNAQLNVTPSLLRPRSLTARGVTLPVRTVHAYAELAPGEVGLVVDSYGYLAIGLFQADAAARLGLKAADQVLLHP